MGKKRIARFQDFMDARDIRFFDNKGLQEEGFPSSMAKVFLETADINDCVVMSRTPGGASTQLIKEGYDLKGYEIKSKSCNWGPMAGFLCKLPPLNKAGFEKIKYNYGNLSKFYKKWEKVANPLTKKKYTFEDLFQPLKISDARKIKLFGAKDNIYGLGVKDTDYLELDDNTIYGICSTPVKIEPENRIRIEYLLLKNKESWSILHGRIFYGESNTIYSGSESLDFFIKDIEKDKGPILTEITQSKKGLPDVILGKERTDSINSLLYKKGISARNNLFKKLEVAQNPYPPYKEQGDKYKNAVTGDYDLFACWPKSEYPLQNLIRKAEHSVSGENYFSSFSKSLNVGLCPKGTFNHIYIDFIPGFPAIDKLEDLALGNINNLAAHIVGTLNNIASTSIDNEGIIHNRAFHSDEGGRPGIDEIEFPVAYFLPKSLHDKLLGKDVEHRFAQFRGGLIKNESDFLDLIRACTENGHRVTLSHGWFIFLITKALKEAERSQLVIKLPFDKKEYFIKYKTLPGEYREKVLKYVLGYSAGNKSYKATPDFLVKVANVFLPFLDMSEATKDIIIGKVELAKGIEYKEDDFVESNPI
jgi:hypothetical protein